ncbi:MAG: HAMP domain-containing histidine kinase, partial [Actinobacteria bacterium]|nr:HAMP domain-containing histidine kinase [Actinomycetota bacterium]
ETGPPETAALAASFNHLSEELRRAQDAERAFLLSVSHELRTPLTAIRGHAEGLLDGVLEPGKAGDVIEREARRLERLIGDLLDLARLRRRSFDVGREALDLRAVAEEGVERFSPRARDFGVTLERGGSGAQCPALGDHDRLLQAVSHLVENAIRCAPRGGTVRIVTAPGRIDVVDDGPGLEADELDRAFERFFLYERYGSDRPIGTGLGLAVVQELAQAMGGTASVVSAPGRGSSFSITLPTPPG